MIKLQRLSNGRLRIVGGRLLELNVASGASPDIMSVVDFQTSYAGVKPVVQRKQGANTADVPVLFTYTGAAPTHPQARVVAASGGAVVRDWATLTTVSAAAGNGLGYLDDVPQGTGYLIQLRDGLDTTDSNTSSAGTTPWGVGVVVLFMGQSNAVGTLNGGAYSDTAPGTGMSEHDYYGTGAVPGSLFDTDGWHRPSNGINGPAGIGIVSAAMYSLLRIVTAALEDLHGIPVPVGLIPWSFGGTTISQYQPGGDKYSALFQGSGTTTGSIGFASPKNIWAGDFECVAWHQGEANNGMSASVYQAELTELYQGLLDYVAPFGRTASGLWFFPAILGVYGPGSVQYAERLRIAVQQFVADAPASGWTRVVPWSVIDCDPADGGDGLHFSDTNGYRMRAMRRVIQSILFATGCATYSGAGPKIGTHSRSGNVVTFNVVHEGGTALQLKNSGSAPTGWYANTLADFTGTDITPTVALITSNTQIQVTLPGGTSYPVYIKYCGNEIGTALSEHPDVTNLIYDNAPYPSTATGTDVEAKGLPLQPSNGAITVS